MPLSSGEGDGSIGNKSVPLEGESSGMDLWRWALLRAMELGDDRARSERRGLVNVWFMPSHSACGARSWGGE